MFVLLTCLFNYPQRIIIIIFELSIFLIKLFIFFFIRLFISESLVLSRLIADLMKVKYVLISNAWIAQMADGKIREKYPDIPRD